MQTYTQFTLSKRIMALCCLLIFVFSSTITYAHNDGLDSFKNEISEYNYSCVLVKDDSSIHIAKTVNLEFRANSNFNADCDTDSGANLSSENMTTNPRIAVIKTGVFQDGNNNNNAEVGEFINYAFTVTNTGDVTINDITIDDPLVDVTGTLNTLAPGASNTTAFTASYPITQNDINNGQVENQAIGNACYNEPYNSNGNCDGQVDSLTLKYNGTLTNSTIKVIEKDGKIVFEGVVEPGQTFDFVGQDPPQMTLGSEINIFINGNHVQQIHTSCSVPIGIGSEFGDFEVIDGSSKNGGEFIPINGNTCSGSVSDLSDNSNNHDDNPTIVLLPNRVDPTPRDCNCTPLYKDSNFSHPTLIDGHQLKLGAVYRFANVFPSNSNGTTLDALVRIEEFSGGASLLEIDVTSSGLDEAFQPRIKSTNSGDQSVLFSITFVEGGGNYGDEVDISFYGTPLDIDGDGVDTREYAELSLPDAYYQDSNTAITITQTNSVIRGESNTILTAPGDEVSLDPRFTYSTYMESKSSIEYRIGKLDGDDDRYYSFNATCVDYTNPSSVLLTYPVICGNVSDNQGDPLADVSIDVTGSDGSSQTVQTDANGNYKAVAEIANALVDVSYEIRENDPVGYISISDVDGANDNLISRTLSVESSCGNDFVDGADAPTGWNFECGDDKIVDEYGYNANCNTTTVAAIPDNSTVYQYVVEIVYKGNNPGQTLTFTEADGTVRTLVRSVPVGSSSNIWVYRGLITGTTSEITYTTTNNIRCKLQSVVIYAFRNAPNASSSSGVFTSRSGVNDVQTITITVPAFTSPRDLIIETPISELTDDGRYLLLKAEAGGVSEQVFIYGSDASLPGGTCCLAIPSLTLSAVPGAATEVTITVDTRNNQNGQTVNGQSWVIASGVNVDGDCFVNTTYAIDDINDTFVNTPVNGNVLTNDFDLEGDTQTVTTTSVTTAQGVTVTIDPNTGAYTYTPPTDFIGQDSFEYTICDDRFPQACDSAFVYIDVVPFNIENNPPVANADTNTTLKNTAVDGNVLPNDYDPDNDPITITTPTVTTAQGVTVTINPDGTYTYTPPTDYVGEDTFEYTICDNGTPPLCDMAVVTIQVLDIIENTTTAVDDAYFGFPNTDVTGNVLDNDTDVEGDDQTVDISISPANGPSNGSVSLNADGTFTYTPNAGYSGQDSFVYTIFDDGTPTIATDKATVIILIAPFVNTTYAIDDINDTFVNTPVNGNVLTNDFDLEGDTQTVTTTSVTTAQGVTVTIDPNTGAYTYTPPTDFIGQDSFEYTICDDRFPQACDSAFVYIDVVPFNIENNPPVANADTNTTLKNTAVDGNVLPNDYDPDNDPITITTPTVTTAQGVTVTINPDGTYTYTPPTDYVGEDTFEYTICDNGTPPLCDMAVVTIQVLDIIENTTTAVDDAYFGFPNTDVTGNVLDNDTDVEGDDQTVDISISPANGPSNGSVSLNADGTFTYTPNAGYSGQDSFVYTIFDDGTPTIATDKATVIILIAPFVNTTYAIDDINDTFVNTPVNGNVLTNDFDLEGDTQTVTTTSVTTAQGVTVTIDPNTGAYTYTPLTDFIGQDSFEYTICDDRFPQACDSAFVYIDVVPFNIENNPPVANADTNTTLKNTAVDGNVLPNDYDPDNDPITITTPTVTTAQGVTVTINPDGTYTYTPPTDYVGEDTFEYTICDNGTPPLCDMAVVTIQVLDIIENTTTAVDDAYFGFPNTDVTGNVLDNDTDVEGDDQTVDISISPANGPSNGSVSLNADGTFTYTPNAGYSGQDSFVYTIFDDGTPTIATDKATVIILIAPFVNTTYAIDDINDTFVNTPVNGNVLTNDFDLEGDTQTVTTTSVTTAQGVTVTIDPNTGAYTYTPPTDFIGQDSFEYTICDDRFPQACDSAIVYIEVQPIGSPENEPPVANADTNTTQVNQSVDGNVLPNDYDPDNDPISVTANTNPSNGSVVINSDGTYTYTPNTDFVGEDTFTYTICDDGDPIPPALCDMAVVTIQVLGITENITTAVDDAYYGFPDTDITGNVLDNDTDPEGDSQTVNANSPLSGPSNGTVTLNSDGTFTYTPNAGFEGTDQFVYEISDNGSPVATDKATVYISISDPTNVILAIDDINDTFANLPVSGSVATNDVNADGPDGTEVFTLIAGTGPTNGTLVFNADGSYTYSPNTDFVGEDSFEYQVCDGGNPIACDTATVYIEVVNEPIIDNDPPVANPDTNKTEVNVPVSGTVLSNDFDPDNDPIVVTSNTNPSNGSVVVNPDGTYTYTPELDFEGEDTFMYTICDNGTPALCDTTIVVIQVIPNDRNITVANDDAYYTEVDTAISANVLVNDSDPEGDTQLVDLTETPVSGPTNGTLVINADGTFIYTPNPGFTGTDQFVYEIFDSGSQSARDLATVYILIQQTPAPAIAIVKEGTLNDNNQSGCSEPGDTISYVFTVTNQGNVPLGNITISDPLLEAPNPVVPIVFISGDTNNDTFLDTSEIWVYAADYEITQVDIDAGQVTNQATVSGTDADGTTVSDLSDESNVLEDDPTVVTVCQNPSIALIKAGTFVDGNGNQCADPGETITYEFTVVNTGNLTLTDVTVTDPLVTVSGGPIVLVPGQTDTTSFSATYTITQADIDAGEVENQATAVGTTPDNSTVSDLSDESVLTEDDPTITVLCQNPSIAIIKVGTFVDGNGNQCADPGETISYEFTVVNTGNVTLTNVNVTDPLVTVSGGPITLAPLASDATSFTAIYAITQADIDAGEVTNQATAEGTAPNGSMVTDLSDESVLTEDDPTITILCQNPSIAIIKVGTFVDGNGNQCSDPGETIEYEFTVVNTGNVTLTDVNVTDPLVTVSGGPITLAPSESDATSFTATYTITQADIDAGEVTNQAIAEGTAPNGSVVTDLSDESVLTEDDPTITVLCQNSSIALLKVGTFIDGNGNGCADPGESIEYAFTVVNTGNLTLTDVTVTDPLVTVTGGPIVLAPGQLDATSFAATYTLTQADIDAGQVVNQATASGTDPRNIIVVDLSDESVLTEDDPTITILCQDPSIAIIKTGEFVDGNGNDCADPGETIEYEFTVVNTGNVTLNNVVVTDPLVTVVGGPVVLTPGQSDATSFTATYTITQADIDAGVVTNQATAEGTTAGGTTVTDLSDESVLTEDDPTITVLCQSASIALLKVGTFIDGNGNDCADPGETIDYEFTVVNTGNVTLANVTVTDPLVVVVGGPIVLAPGETDAISFTATYVITQADIDAGNVTNQATAEGTAPDGTTVTDLSDESVLTEDDPTITILCQSPSIALIKEGEFPPIPGGGCSVEGDVIEYTFTVVNTGNISLDNVIVTDPLVAVVGGPISLEPGETDTTTFTASYTITQADVDAGQVINQATAEGTTPSGVVVTDLSDDEVLTEDDPTVVPICQTVVIALIKEGVFNDESGNKCSEPDETITYTFTVFNMGNVTLTNITIQDPLVNVVGGPITLAPFTSDGTTFTANYVITQSDIDAGFVENQAIVSGFTILGEEVTDLSDDNSEFQDDPTIVDLCQEPRIGLIKVGTPTDENGNGCIDVDETIMYDFVVTNLGNTVLTNVIVTDPMVTVDGGPVTIAAGISDTETFTALYTVTQADVDAGFVTNQATVEGTAPDGTVLTDLSDDNSNFENDPTVLVLCQSPKISLEKTGEFQDENGDGIPQVGETVTYEFAVTNTGNVTLFNITLSDPLPGIVVEGDPIAVLAIGETNTDNFTAIYAITQQDIDDARVINQAFATGTDANGNEVVDDSDDPTDLTNTDNNGDGDPDDPTIVILPNVESTFEIFNGVTPNGDGLNDFFEIRGISEFPQNNVKIFNRWGVLVFETNGYDESDNVFRGVSNGRSTIRQGEELPTGTYFYILTFTGEDTPEDRNSYNGYLYINR